MSILASVITIILFQVFAGPLVMLFNADAAVIREGILYLRICCSFNCIAYAAMYTYNAFATGVGDAMFSFLNSMLDCVVIRIFGSLFLGFALGYGFAGIYIAESFAPVLPAIVSGVYFVRRKWKTSRLVAP